MKEDCRRFADGAIREGNCESCRPRGCDGRPEGCPMGGARAESGPLKRGEPTLEGPPVVEGCEWSPFVLRRRARRGLPALQVRSARLAERDDSSPEGSKSGRLLLRATFMA